MAVDTLGHLLALYVTPADEQDRAQVGELAQQVQAVTGENVEIAVVDRAIPVKLLSKRQPRRVFIWKWSNFLKPG